MQTYPEYQEMIDAYRTRVLSFIQQNRQALAHWHPNISAMPSVMLCNIIDDGRKTLLQAEYMHKPFYKALGAITAAAYALIPDECGGSGAAMVGALETAVAQLSENMTVNQPAA